MPVATVAVETGKRGRGNSSTRGLIERRIRVENCGAGLVERVTAQGNVERNRVTALCVAREVISQEHALRRLTSLGQKQRGGCLLFTKQEQDPPIPLESTQRTVRERTIAVG